MRLAVALGSILFFSFGRAAEPAALASNPPGCSYFHETLPQGPWSIHGVKVERGSTDFRWHTTQGLGATMGVGTLSSQVLSLPKELGQPLAAINGDFAKASLQFQAHPVGLQIMRGELLNSPGPDVCLWFTPQGQPQAHKVSAQYHVIWPNNQTTPIGLNDQRTNGGAVLYTSVLGPTTRVAKGREIILERNGTDRWLPLAPGETIAARVVEVRETGNSPLSTNTLVLSLSPRLLDAVPAVTPGTVLKIATDLTPDLRGVTTALGGGPMLVRDGRVQSFANGSESYGQRHPRTAVGWNDQATFLVVVDGRQKKLSVGMTMAELANYMIKLGCRQAINLDGGGSSTFWWRGEVVNSPCELRERPMVNALVLVQPARVGEPVSVDVGPKSATAPERGVVSRKGEP